jgi:DNA-binding GntR family transcriptional regulator
MDASILCSLLANVIDPTHFQVWGTDIHWMVVPTQEEITLANDVITNYESLAAAYLQAQAQEAQAEALKQQAKAQAIEDNLPSWQQVSDAIDAATTIAACKVIIKKMARIIYWLAKNSNT